MSLFGFFKRKRNKARHRPEERPHAGETAPGLKAIKELWDIEGKKPQERIHGEVETNIYATNRSNGVPRRQPPNHLRRLPRDDSSENSF